MKTLAKPVCTAIAVAACGFPLSSRAAVPSDLAQLDFFEKKIRPVLVESCYECHSATSKKVKGGLLLDTSEGLMKGGDSGPAVVPGKPAKSLLITSIRHEDKDPDMAMPPKKDKLTDAVIADFEEWVKMGAPDPRTSKALAKSATWDATKYASHWAFQKISHPPVPTAPDPAHFVENPIDNFVLAKLAEKKLKPSPKADKLTLIRRVTYDLTGLPPTPVEVDAFLADSSPKAFEKVVDRLLDSPRYGERWGRHWLDIARYADTSGDRQGGAKRQPAYPHAWTYRDYVIESLNKDLPYDRFVMEQIAADRLPESQQDKLNLRAMGFLTVGKRFMGNENDVLDDRIDVVTKGLMGLTGTCARCHDHKFDPIPTQDYYSLHGIFSSSEEPKDSPPVIDPAKNPAYPDYLAQVAKIEDEVGNFGQTEAARVLAGMLDKAGDYLMMVHDAGRTSDKRKKGDNFRLAARDKGLKAELAAVWLDQIRAIEAGKNQKDPVFGPWLQFAALPVDKFAEQAPEVLKAIAASTDYDPALAKALCAKAPATLQDVAAVYTQLLGDLRTKLDLPEFSGARGGKGGFDIAKTEVVLADESMEGLRKEIFGGDSSVMPREKALARAFGNQFTTQQNAIRAKLVSLEITHPGAPVRAMALVDKPTPKDSRVLVRGEPGSLGPVAPRQFLAVLAGKDRKPFTDGSGRLELARAIASRDNPLTARVIVNRMWQWHFGQALVRTVNDFGTRSEPPTHPELLDWLATSLMDNGWSLKKLHKLMVLSATYQQDSRPTDAGLGADPTNQWLWRFNIQRLDFEEVRDSLLAVGDKLDSTMGGQPFSLGGPAAGRGKGKYASLDLSNLKATTNRRTVYAIIDRSGLPDMFNTFDFANPDMSTGERVLTIVPQQALFMMNSPFMAEQVKNLLARPDFPAAGTDEEKVRFIFRTVFQRAPAPEELELARQFLSSDSDKPAETVEVAAKAPEPLDGASERKFRKKTKVAAAQNVTALNAWERYTQAILLKNEFIFVR